MTTLEPDLPPPTATADFEAGRVIRSSKKGKWQKFVSYIWDPDYYEKSDLERRLVFKLDCFMLSVLTLGWWLKNLDQSNLANAYVSGMKEDLDIQQNQYTYMLTIYNAVVAAMQIPSNFIVLKVRPSLFLALSEIGWGVFTFAQAGAKSYQHMYGFRFCVALFESFYYPIAYFILGSWYTRPELAKRIGLWFIASPAGSAFSGYLQAAIYRGMNGLHGLAGWQWLYIVCGIITVPCGIIIFFLVPDFPENSRAWYLNEEERALARERVMRNGGAGVKATIDGRAVLRAVKSWKFWILAPLFCLYGFAVQDAQQFAIYLKAYGYSVTMRNVLPSTQYVIEIPSLLIWCYISDRLARYSRAYVMLVPMIWGLFPLGVLAFWAPSNSLRVFAFMVNGTYYMTPIFFAWVAEMCAKEPAVRGFITGSATCLFYVFNAWLPTVVFLQTDGPRFKKGFMTTFFSMVAAIVLLIIAIILRRPEQRKEEAEEAAERRDEGRAEDHDEKDSQRPRTP